MRQDNNPIPELGPPETTADQRRSVVITARHAVVATLVVVVLGVVGFGAFLAGQSTRESADQVARETKTTVSAAVVKAVAAKGADDKAKRLRIMHRAANRINARHRSEVRQLRRSNARRVSQAYSSGSSAGRAAGYSAGVDDGITKASDQVTCSDDPDVPLPYCWSYGD